MELIAIIWKYNVTGKEAAFMIEYTLTDDEIKTAIDEYWANAERRPQYVS